MAGGLNANGEMFTAWIKAGNLLSGLDAADIRKAVKEQDEEQGGERFLPEELAIAGLLGLAWNTKGKKAADTIMEILTQRGLQSFDDAVAAVAPDMASVFEYADTPADVKAALRKTLRYGSELSGASQDILFSGGYEQRVKDILDDMTQNTRYFTNKYFNQQVVPELHKIIEKAIAGGVHAGEPLLLNTEAYQSIQAAMDARLTSTPYWRVVANASASRGYHFGAIKAGALAGQRGYEIVAVLDNRTSDICVYMNGKQFWTADADYQVNKMASATDEEIKAAAPWLRAAEVIGKSADELKDMSFIVPPFHGHCRSTIRFI